MMLMDPIGSHKDEVSALVKTAAARGQRVDGYFGQSRYYGAATPVGSREGGRVIRFVWLGPTESRGERKFLVRER